MSNLYVTRNYNFNTQSVPIYKFDTEGLLVKPNSVVIFGSLSLKTATAGETFSELLNIDDIVKLLLKEFNCVLKIQSNQKAVGCYGELPLETENLTKLLFKETSVLTIPKSFSLIPNNFILLVSFDIITWPETESTIFEQLDPNFEQFSIKLLASNLVELNFLNKKYIMIPNKNKITQILVFSVFNVYTLGPVVEIIFNEKFLARQQTPDFSKRIGLSTPIKIKGDSSKWNLQNIMFFEGAAAVGNLLDLAKIERLRYKTDLILKFDSNSYRLDISNLSGKLENFDVIVEEGIVSSDFNCCPIWFELEFELETLPLADYTILILNFGSRQIRLNREANNFVLSGADNYLVAAQTPKHLFKFSYLGYCETLHFSYNQTTLFVNAVTPENFKFRTENSQITSLLKAITLNY